MQEQLVYSRREDCDNLLPRLQEPKLLDILLHGNILARPMFGELRAILRRKVKRDHVVRLLHLPLHDKLLPPLPTGLSVQLRLTIDADMRELPISSDPGIVQFALEDIRTKDIGDRLKEVCAHDGVLFRDDVQRGVFVADPFNDGEDRRQVIDVGSIRVYGACKGLGLVASL